MITNNKKLYTKTDTKTFNCFKLIIYLGKTDNFFLMRLDLAFIIIKIIGLFNLSF